MSNQDNLDTASAPADGKWVFDENVAKSFPDMLARSIPGYKDMRDVIHRVAMKTRRVGTMIDLGASNGEGCASLIENKEFLQYILYDVSEPMLKLAKDRFAGNDNVVVKEFDLRKSADVISSHLRADSKFNIQLILATLTLIFVPINFRPQVLRGVYEALDNDGRFILTEKLQGSDWLMDDVLVNLYHEYKHDHGYSWEAIERKRLSLEGVQIPLTEEINIQMLRSAGFKHVEVVHRYLNFATFLAIK